MERRSLEPAAPRTDSGGAAEADGTDDRAAARATNEVAKEATAGAQRGARPPAGSGEGWFRPELAAGGAARSDAGGLGDARCLAEVHVRYRRRLEAVAFRVLRDRDEAEDVVARVFEALPQARYRGQSSLWTYLYRAATNGAVSVLRKRRRRENLEEELRARVELDAIPARGGLGDAEASVLEGEILSAVASALLDVKPQHRRALVLRIVWGLTNTEIAAHEGVPLPTVGTWLRRGREELRARLDSLLRDLGRGGEGG